MQGEYFESLNGVRQGGVISPLIFTVYMDEMICRLLKSGIGCFIGQEYYGCLGYADDFVLLCPSLKGLQRMIDLCAEFGLEFSVMYNAKKTKCMTFEFTQNRHIPGRFAIRLDGKALDWTTSIKHLGNYIRSDLSESDEMRHKQCDFIGRFNGLIARYHDAIPEVLMQLTGSYCTHLYGSQAWQFTDKNMNRMIITWQKAIRRIWKLPYHSHRVLLCGLNEGKHVYDNIFTRFLRMYKCMDRSSNQKMSFLVAMAKQDKRSIIARNIQFICEKVKAPEADIIHSQRYDCHVYKSTDILNNEQTIAMIIELNHGIPGFDESEIKDILEFISTE